MSTSSAVEEIPGPGQELAYPDRQRCQLDGEFR